MLEKERRQALLKGISEQLKPVLENSGQAVFIYLDNDHKVCNKNFATLLGYPSANTWATTEVPLADVADSDRGAVTAAYENGVKKMLACTLDVRFQNVRTFKTIPTRLIVVPVVYGGKIFLMNFVSRT